jgi:hypothetical protein
MIKYEFRQFVLGTILLACYFYTLIKNINVLIIAGPLTVVISIVVVVCSMLIIPFCQTAICYIGHFLGIARTHICDYLGL